MNDEELRAWRKEGINPTAPPDKQIIYCIARAMYADYEAEIIEQRDAQAIKLNALDYLAFLQSMARTNTKIIKELSKATAPRAELPKKSKEELLEIIVRIEALVTGIIRECSDKLPSYLTFEAKEDKNEPIN